MAFEFHTVVQNPHNLKFLFSPEPIGQQMTRLVHDPLLGSRLIPAESKVIGSYRISELRTGYAPKLLRILA
jgi:hypothetical protein